MSQHQDPVEEAKRIIDLAQNRNIQLKLLGGVAFYFRCPSARSDKLRRKYVDLDFICRKDHAAKLNSLFTELDYVPREVFNALQGDRRLIYNDLRNSRRVDIFLDIFEMCHKFNFKERLNVDDSFYTIPLADLLLTKLQIVEFNHKDLNDMACMIIDHDVSESEDGDFINGGYIAEICSGQWGIYKTVITNLSNLDSHISSLELDESTKTIASSRIDCIRKLIESAPKSMKWKLRASVGEKVKWYELPEMDKEVVDSRPFSTNQKTENQPRV